MAILDMATSSGSLSKRISQVYINYFYKLDWKRDIDFLPKDCREDFTKLHFLMFENARESMHSKRQEYIKKFSAIGVNVSDDSASNAYTLERELAQMHWKKSKEIADLIANIYSDITLHIKYSN